MERRKKIEFGDFQTPDDLADIVIALLKSLRIKPAIVVEPTCGTGSFVEAALRSFPSTTFHFAFDVNPEYVKQVKLRIANIAKGNCNVEHVDFFYYNWKKFFSDLPDNILVLGNPPWVNNSKLSLLSSNNLPVKSNFQKHRGFAAKTGKANFDISEWILIKLIEALNDKQAYIAMLCKAATARKVLHHAWHTHLKVKHASIHLFDSAEFFGVSVEACLLIVETGSQTTLPKATIFQGLNFKKQVSNFGIIDGEMIADIDCYTEVKEIEGLEYYRWRSGIKHDASAVMELKIKDGYYWNGLGEQVNIENTSIYPLLKSSDIANERIIPSKHVIVTQHEVGEDTAIIRQQAPLTWKYLLNHSKILDNRKSMIYEKRSRFAIFGVGEYSFAPWKVAISALYRNIHFTVIGSFDGKPIVLDDTCYFVPCRTKAEAQFIAELLNSEVAQKFIRSLIFFDSKRAVTIDVLKRIDIKKIAEKLERVSDAYKYLSFARYENKLQPQFIFEKPVTSYFTRAKKLGKSILQHRSK